MYIDNQNISKILFYNLLSPQIYQESYFEIRNRIPSRNSESTNTEWLHLQSVLYHLLTVSTTLTTVKLQNPDLNLVEVTLKAMSLNSKISTLILEEIDYTTMQVILAWLPFLPIKHLYLNHLPYASFQLLLQSDIQIWQQLRSIQLYLIGFNCAVQSAFLNKLYQQTSSSSACYSFGNCSVSQDKLKTPVHAADNELVVLQVEPKQFQFYQTKILYYDNYIKNHPNNAIAYNQRGIIKRKLGYLQDAIMDYTMAIQINPQYAFFYYHRAIARKAAGLYELAIQDSLQAITLSPNEPDFYNNLSIIRAILGQYQPALDNINQALMLTPSDADFLNNCGLIHQAIGNYNEALQYFGMAHVQAPTQQIHVNNYQYAQILFEKLPIIQECFRANQFMTRCFFPGYSIPCQVPEPNFCTISELPLEDLFQGILSHKFGLESANRQWNKSGFLRNPIEERKHNPKKPVRGEVVASTQEHQKKYKVDSIRNDSQIWCNFWQNEKTESPSGSPLTKIDSPAISKAL